MLKTIDLFAGAGGLSYGFEATEEFKIVAAAEIDKNARETYKANHKDGKNIVMIEDVRGYDFKALSDKLGGIDIVIGGPPCQGFSNANRQKNHIISMNNSLVKEYFRAIKEIRPKAFVMENVSMLSSETHKFYDSARDHDVVASFDNFTMQEDDITISESNYNGINSYEALNSDNKKYYTVSPELFQHLNVLQKNEKSKEDRFKKYVKKNGNIIIKLIEDYFKSDHYDYEILHDIHDHIFDETLISYIENLRGFIKFQKSFMLKKELDDNEIIYRLESEGDNGRVRAKVKSYSVFDYADRILGTEYIKNNAVLDALWFGVPQDRKRFIMIGVRSDIMKEKNIIFPDGKDAPAPTTVGEAIMDLANVQVAYTKGEDQMREYNLHENISDYAKLMRKDSNGVKNHLIPESSAEALERFNELEEGQNFHKLPNELKGNYADPDRTQKTIYLKLDRNKPSGTVVNVRKSMWVHPTQNRAISVREAARLQSFPDRFIFMGGKDSQYQQVGNAVPPLMAEGIAKILLKYF